MKAMDDIAKLLVPHHLEGNQYDGVKTPEIMALESGISKEKIVRLNANENPYGCSRMVSEALADVRTLHIYPDQTQSTLRNTISRFLDITADNIVIGNGSDEIIDLTMRLFVDKGDEVIQAIPTFGMYEFYALRLGGRTISVKRKPDFEVDLMKLKAAISERTKIIFLASPNNPTGNQVSQSDICAILDMGPIVVVDEAYFEYCGETVLPLIYQYSNLVVLRTFSKWAGLAGLRIGVGAMGPELARLMMSIKPPYNVNSAAELAVIASLKDIDYLKLCIKLVLEERQRLFSLIGSIPGMKPFPSRANFLFVSLPSGRGKEIYEGLAKKGIFVRYYPNSGLDDYIRISVGLPEHTDKLIEGIKDILKE